MKKSKNNNIILGFGYWVFEFGFSWCKGKVIWDTFCVKTELLTKTFLLVRNTSTPKYVEKPGTIEKWKWSLAGGFCFQFPGKVSKYTSLEASKSRKQIFLSSHTYPKKPTKVFTFFALDSKKPQEMVKKKG